MQVTNVREYFLIFLWYYHFPTPYHRNKNSLKHNNISLVITQSNYNIILEVFFFLLVTTIIKVFNFSIEFQIFFQTLILYLNSGYRSNSQFRAQLHFLLTNINYWFLLEFEWENSNSVPFFLSSFLTSSFSTIKLIS